MIELSTVYKNTHKFLKEKMAADFNSYEQAHNGSVFDQVQALVFASLSEKEPQKSKDAFLQLVDAYGNDPDFKALVNKALNHVKEQYKGETLKFPDGRKVNVDKFVDQTQKQLEAGKIDFAGRLNATEVKERAFGEED